MSRSSNSGIDTFSGWCGWPARGCPATRGEPSMEKTLPSPLFRASGPSPQGAFPRDCKSRRSLRVLFAITVRKAVTRRAA